MGLFWLQRSGYRKEVLGSKNLNFDLRTVLIKQFILLQLIHHKYEDLPLYLCEILYRRSKHFIFQKTYLQLEKTHWDSVNFIYYFSQINKRIMTNGNKNCVFNHTASRLISTNSCSVKYVYRPFQVFYISSRFYIFQIVTLAFSIQKFLLLRTH